MSSIVVVGGCGDYFDVHNTCLLVDNYVVSDVTERAHSVSVERGCSLFASLFVCFVCFLLLSLLRSSSSRVKVCARPPPGQAVIVGCLPISAPVHTFLTFLFYSARVV